ncbi:MAG: Sec-independent protein translocase protein TatB [Pseudomonadota bacterium]
MFDIGFWELLIIAIVLLLVMGPERLPEVAKQAAFFLRKARQGMARLRNEMQSEIDGTPFADLQDARREMTDLKNDVRQLGRDLADSVEREQEAHTDDILATPSNEATVDQAANKPKVAKQAKVTKKSSVAKKSKVAKKTKSKAKAIKKVSKKTTTKKPATAGKKKTASKSTK